MLSVPTKERVHLLFECLPIGLSEAIDSFFMHVHLPYAVASCGQSMLAVTAQSGWSQGHHSREVAPRVCEHDKK
jgi:hypothetical protein